MKRRHSLEQLAQDYDYKISRLERKFLSCLRSQVATPGLISRENNPYKEPLTYVVIELLNRFRQFNRAFLFSVLSGAKSKRQTIFKSRQVKDEFDFIDKVFKIYPKKTVDAAAKKWESKEEPAWEAEIFKISMTLGLPNDPVIQTSKSLSVFYKELKVFRNFCAHRNPSIFSDAQLLAQNKSIVGASFEDILLKQSTTSNQYLILDWVKNSRDYANYLCY